MKAGQTPYGEPTKKMPLGHTAVPLSVFEEFLSALSTSQFKPTSYNLLKNNCNHFSNEVSNFLCGVDIPKDILDLPEQVRGTWGCTSIDLKVDSGSDDGGQGEVGQVISFFRRRVLPVAAKGICGSSF